MLIFSHKLQQRVKAASSAEHMKVLSLESSNADSYFQQLDKLRMVYEEYVKLSKETIPVAEKNLHELTEELDQKSQAFDDVSRSSLHFLFRYFSFLITSALDLWFSSFYPIQCFHLQFEKYFNFSHILYLFGLLEEWMFFLFMYSFLGYRLVSLTNFLFFVDLVHI